MKIHTRDRTAIVAPVELESGDDVGYAGHFTIESLVEFAKALAAKYESHRVVAISPVFRKDFYTLVAILDEEEEVKENEHLAVAGCKCGRDGTE